MGVHCAMLKPKPFILQHEACTKNPASAGLPIIVWSRKQAEARLAGGEAPPTALVIHGGEVELAPPG